MLSVPELFRRASIEMRGPVPWETPIPETASGVYVIGLVDPAASFSENLAEAELSRWNAGQEIIYIGKAMSLRIRLAQFYNHKHGDPSPHRGGQDIKLLTAPMQVYWGTALDCEKAEHSMIGEFYSEVGALPFGNRNRGTKKRSISN
jgi:hypothetical protein